MEDMEKVALLVKWVSATFKRENDFLKKGNICGINHHLIVSDHMCSLVAICKVLYSSEKIKDFS